LGDNILAPLSGRIESFFLQNFLGKLNSNPYYYILFGNSIEGRIPSSYIHFDEPYLGSSSGDSTHMLCKGCHPILRFGIFSSDGIMEPWELHQMFPSLDSKNVPGYPNHFSLNWGDNCPEIDGNPSSTITHVVKFLKYTS
jgi:hypothetical protein